MFTSEEWKAIYEEDRRRAIIAEEERLEQERIKAEVNSCTLKTSCLLYRESEGWNKEMQKKFNEKYDELQKRYNDLLAENLKLKKQINPDYEPVKIHTAKK